MVNRPTNIGAIEFDALISETVSYSAEVPQYPVESGYSVSDDIITSPLTISATLLVSDLPVTWKARFANQANRVITVREQLKQLYIKGEPVVYRSSSGIYKNMAIDSLSYPMESGSKAVEISVSLVQVRVTQAEVVDIASSYCRSGATGEYVGSASVTNATSGATVAEEQETSAEKCSVLYGLVDSFQGEHDIGALVTSFLGG